MGTAFKLRNGSLLLSTEAPGGIYNSAQLKKIAALSDENSAIVKVTEDQRLALFVKEDRAQEIADELKAIGLGIRHYQDGLHQATSCIGELCPEHKQDALASAMQLSEELAEISLTSPMRIGINGCARCCVPCHTLDISVIGDDSGYRICLGGKSSQIPEMAAFMAEGVPEDKLPALLRQIIELYQQYGEDDESLQEVMERIGVSKFTDILKPYSQDAAAGEDDLFASISMPQEPLVDELASDEQPGPMIEDFDAANLDDEQALMIDSDDDVQALTIDSDDDDELAEEVLDDEQALMIENNDDEVDLLGQQGDEQALMVDRDDEVEVAGLLGDEQALMVDRDDEVEVAGGLLGDEQALMVDRDDEVEVAGGLLGDEQAVMVESDEDDLAGGEKGDDEQALMIDSDEDELVEDLALAEQAPRAAESLKLEGEESDEDEEVMIDSLVEPQGESYDEGLPADASSQLEAGLDDFDDELPNLDMDEGDDDNQILAGHLEQEDESRQAVMAAVQEQIPQELDELDDQELALADEMAELELAAEQDGLVDLDEADQDVDNDTDEAIALDDESSLAADSDIDEASLPDFTERESLELEEEQMDSGESDEESEQDFEEKLAQDIDHSATIHQVDRNLEDRNEAIKMLEESEDDLDQASGRDSTATANGPGAWDLEGINFSESGDIILTFQGGATIQLSPAMLVHGRRSLRVGDKTIKIQMQGDLISIEMDDGLKMAIPAEAA